MNEWINVKEMVPEPYERVLVYIDHEDVQSIDVYVWDKWLGLNSVTHWMALPEPPKEEEC